MKLVSECKVLIMWKKVVWPICMVIMTFQSDAKRCYWLRLNLFGATCSHKVMSNHKHKQHTKHQQVSNQEEHLSIWAYVEGCRKVNSTIHSVCKYVKAQKKLNKYQYLA